MMPKPITRARIEAQRDKVAHLMVNHDRPQYAPVFRRLTSELEKMDEQDRAMAAARAVLAGNQKEL